jgi:sigma-B regulation protein RsbU (phosphoserine phosphatase)
MSPIIRRADGSLDEPAGPDNSALPIGVDPDCRFQVVRAQLSPGDSVVIFSDGISEAMNGSGAEYTVGRIREQVHEHGPQASDLGPTLLDDVRGHVAGSKQNDDMTLVVFSRAAE